MDRVRAAARDDVQNGAGGVPELCREAVGHHGEFLNPVLRKRIGLDAVELHRVGPAVDEDVVLILSLSGGREAHGSRTHRRHPGRELREIAEAPIERRKIVDLLRVDVQSDRVLRFD